MFGGTGKDFPSWVAFSCGISDSLAFGLRMLTMRCEYGGIGMGWGFFFVNLYCVFFGRRSRLVHWLLCFSLAMGRCGVPYEHDME